MSQLLPLLLLLLLPSSPLQQEAGVSGGLIVQPANHMYDHTYVSSVLQAHPDKFVGCLLADPTPGAC